MTSRNNQAGMASIVVVSMLVIILTLISVGYARLMSRTLNSSVNNQLGSGAYYAARSAISDATAYLADNPDVVADDCDDLLGTPGEGLEPSSNQLLQASNQAVSYKCILIDQTPTELSYQKIDAFKSQVVKLDPVGSAITSLRLTWQGSNGDGVGSPDNLTLPSPTNWATRKYEPLLRVTIYPVVNDADQLTLIEGRAKTFFLYPSSGGSQSFSFGTTNGSLQSITCSSSNNYHCNVNITNLNCGGDCGYYYLRLTPFYAQADIKIKANGGLTEFVGAQAAIDATAKSNTSTRRLLATVDIGTNNISPSDNAIPEYAIRSATTLCKRLNVNQPLPATPTNGIDSSAQAYCNLTLN